MSQSNKEPKTPEFDKLWNYNKPEETAEKFRAILDDVKNSGNRSEYLQLLTQLARTQGLQTKFDEAHKILDEVEPLLTPDLKLAKIRYLLERGRTFNSSKQIDKARTLFLEAYELGKDEGTDFDDYTIDAVHMLGICEPPEEGVKWNLLGMELAEKSHNEKAKRWLGPLYNNTGWTFHDEKKYDKALELFEKNVKWHTERNTGQKLIIAKWSVARVMRSLNKVEEALKMQSELLDEIEKNNLEHDGYIFEELAECNLLLGNKEEAKKNFAKAYEMLSKDVWLKKYEEERLNRMKKLSGE